MKQSIPFKCCPSIQYNYHLIKLYTDASKRMTSAYLLIYSIIFTSLFFFVPGPVIVAWAGIALLHLILRHIVARKTDVALSSLTSADVDKYLRWSIYISIYGGILWGSLVWLNFTYLPHEYHYISVAITLGLAAAAIANLSMIFVSYLAFLLSMMVTEVLVLVSTDEIEDLLVALMLAVYVVVIIPTARLVYTRTNESFELSFTLKKSQEELAALNETLEERIQEKTSTLEHNYYHDLLTGLPNLKKLSEVIELEQKGHIVLLDIREFGIVNKQYGKVIADKVLVSVAELLSRQLSPGISLFRGETDRFVMYNESMTLQETEEYVKQIISFFEVYIIEIDDLELFITFKAGISDVCDSDECLVHAEYALTTAKRQGVKYFTYDVTQEALKVEKEIISWLSRTKELILSESVQPYFQPIFDIKQNKITKYECLARGIIDGDVVAPYQFLNAAERLNLTKNITRIMVDKSFAFFKGNNYDFSINLTGSDLLDEHFIDYLDIKFKRHQIAPSRVTFEVLENITTYSSGNNVLESLDKIKQRGCKIAIDDFGAENSNFSRLVEIDLDFIKIDGLFIKNILTNEKDQKIVQSIVGLAKTLGVDTVAEYIETEEILELLKEYGVDYAQGYYIGKPEEYLVEELALE